MMTLAANHLARNDPLSDGNDAQFCIGPWLRSNVLTVEDGDPRSPLSLSLVSLQFLEPSRLNGLGEILDLVERA